MNSFDPLQPIISVLILILYTVDSLCKENWYNKLTLKQVIFLVRKFSISLYFIVFATLSKQFFCNTRLTLFYWSQGIHSNNNPIHKYVLYLTSMTNQFTLFDINTSWRRRLNQHSIIYVYAFLERDTCTLLQFFLNAFNLLTTLVTKFNYEQWSDCNILQ